MPRFKVLWSLLAAAVLTTAGPAVAQYDRDGRYVPSPMGVPQDPYARPIPGYSGAPGDAKGTPIWPRGAMPSPPEIAPLAPAPLQPVYPGRDRSRRQVVDCRRPWSKDMGIPRATHRALCRSHPDDPGR